jgi:aminocarboxymuconate-semialdehyde decarboxylase
MTGELQHGVIDVHAHVVPGTFPDNPSAAERRWPCMICGAGGKRTVNFDGKPFRELDDRSWSAARRIETMEQDGLAVQVLSPMPELLSYWFEPHAAEVMGDYVNGFIAEMIAEAPARFRGLGIAPMQDPAAAVRSLTTLKDRFGLDGIEVGSNILGVPAGDERFEPVWGAAEDLGLAVFVHALHPLATTGMTSPALITPLAGFPLDTGLAAASFILSGVLARHPRLRIGFSHGGGALGSLLGRLQKGWQLTGGFNGLVTESPIDTASRLFYDSNVYDPAYLAYLATQLAPGHVFLGTDYPYDILQTDPAAYLRALPVPAEVKTSLESGAALRFLGRESPA